MLVMRIWLLGISWLVLSYCPSVALSQSTFQLLIGNWKLDSLAINGQNYSAWLYNKFVVPVIQDSTMMETERDSVLANRLIRFDAAMRELQSWKMGLYSSGMVWKFRFEDSAIEGIWSYQSLTNAIEMQFENNSYSGISTSIYKVITIDDHHLVLFKTMGTDTIVEYYTRQQ